MEYLIADYLVLLDVVQCRDCKAAFIVWAHIEVDIP